MKWNLVDITFLHPPDVFTGSFDNPIMQARHEEQMLHKLEKIKAALDLETDPLAAMQTLHGKEHHTFFMNNLGSFRDAGVMEEAVLTLYRRLNGPFASGGDAAVWNSLIESCDTSRLYNLGQPVTFTSATVFAGSVSGFTRSLSWTPDRQMAERFAERWQDPSMGGGELYEVDVTKANILVYLKHRRGEEILLAPEFIKSAEIRGFVPGK